MQVSFPSATLAGIEALPVDVEVDVSTGLPNIAIVGLADSAIRESRDRIRAAIRNAGFPFPPRRITVNLAPADRRKEGTAFDLPTAVGILAAAADTPPALSWQRNFLFLGELSLDGGVRGVRGILPAALMAAREGYAGLVLAPENIPEAAVVENLHLVGIRHLREAADLLAAPDPPAAAGIPRRPDEEAEDDAESPDYAEVRGQHHARRALEIAAAGGHNLLFNGPPGTGKTMLAERLPTILPPLARAEAIETTVIHSVAGLIPAAGGLLGRPPFRQPHHSASDAALAGGGNPPRPGEISLAHNGVLFLDEIAEFRRSIIELLRQPLEDRRITIARSAATVTFPAGFLLVAAMNPCPCGFFGHPRRECTCTPQQLAAYRGRLSGPLLDRIDIQVTLVPVEAGELLDHEHRGEPSAAIRSRVIAARNRQRRRLSGRAQPLNAAMGERDRQRFCRPDAAGRALLEQAVDRLGLSARGVTRTLKVARTIADLAAREEIGTAHVAEAIQLRVG
ncbi:MAG: YifB family Mg chelatase-like AAA ATPase [Deltaproteobacteria bacterium]|nr:YifB family Mg chelatase-like AAA ATPase [Candidatus Anaeroferrophillacea bacterium]